MSRRIKHFSVLSLFSDLKQAFLSPALVKKSENPKLSMPKTSLLNRQFDPFATHGNVSTFFSFCECEFDKMAILSFFRFQVEHSTQSAAVSKLFWNRNRRMHRRSKTTESFLNSHLKPITITKT